MNDHAAAYLAKHAVIKLIGGVPECMLPLDKLQGFLDLLGPGDVPPGTLQRLYAMQATAVQTVQAHVAHYDASATNRLKAEKRVIDPDTTGGA